MNPIAILLLALLGLAQPTTTPADAPDPSLFIEMERSPVPTVGTEGQLDVVLGYEDLEPAPVDPRADLIVRIAERRRWGTGWRYDLRYVTAIPGAFDLATALRRPDGSTPDLPALEVEAVGLLADDHDGTLGGIGGGPGQRWPWYGYLATAIGLAWIGTMTFLLLNLWKPKPADAEAATAHRATLADRLRPLVEGAAKNELTPEQRGELERLLVKVWRRRVNVAGGSHAEMIRRLHAHPDAGPLLIALERWLHRPPGSESVDEAEITRLLEPYRNLPDDAGEGGEA